MPRAAKPPPTQAELTAAARRANVRMVREAAAELRLVENALADAEARLPALRAKVTAIRASIERVVGDGGE